MAQVETTKQYFDLDYKKGRLVVNIEGNEVHFEVRASLADQLRDATPVLALDAEGNEVKYVYDPSHNQLILSAFVELVNQAYWQRTASQPVKERNPYMEALIDEWKYKAWLRNDWNNDMRNEMAMARGAN